MLLAQLSALAVSVLPSSVPSAFEHRLAEMKATFHAQGVRPVSVRDADFAYEASSGAVEVRYLLFPLEPMPTDLDERLSGAVKELAEDYANALVELDAPFLQSVRAGRGAMETFVPKAVVSPARRRGLAALYGADARGLVLVVVFGRTPEDVVGESARALHALAFRTGAVAGEPAASPRVGRGPRPEPGAAASGTATLSGRFCGVSNMNGLTATSHIRSSDSYLFDGRGRYTESGTTSGTGYLNPTGMGTGTIGPAQPYSTMTSWKEAGVYRMEGRSLVMKRRKGERTECKADVAGGRVTGFVCGKTAYGPEGC